MKFAKRASMRRTIAAASGSAISAVAANEIVGTIAGTKLPVGDRGTGEGKGARDRVEAAALPARRVFGKVAVDLARNVAQVLVGKRAPFRNEFEHHLRCLVVARQLRVECCEHAVGWIVAAWTLHRGEFLPAGLDQAA